MFFRRMLPGSILGFRCLGISKVSRNLCNGFEIEGSGSPSLTFDILWIVGNQGVWS